MLPTRSPVSRIAHAAIGLSALLAATVLAASPAKAATGILYTTAGSVKVGDFLTDNEIQAGSPATLTFTSNGKTATITCTAVVAEADVVTNTAASADLQITRLTFSGCTVTGLTGVTISSIAISGSGTATVTDTQERLMTISALTEVVTLNTGLGKVNCGYGATSTHPLVGHIVNPNSSGTGGTITFDPQVVPLISGLSTCGAPGSTGTFSVVFGTAHDSSAGNLAVYVA